MSSGVAGFAFAALPGGTRVVGSALSGCGLSLLQQAIWGQGLLPGKAGKNKVGMAECVLPSTEVMPEVLKM